MSGKDYYSLTLQSDLYWALKAAAVQERLSIREALSRAVRDYLRGLKTVREVD